MLKTMSVVAAIAIAFNLAACGKDESAPDARQPVIKNSLTPEERARYCYLSVPQETDVALQDWVKELQGTWVHYPTGPGEAFTRRELRLDFGARIAAVSTYYNYGHDVEDITFNKACLSQPLDASYGAYAGYRVIEFMAANNQGAAAMLIKLENRGVSVLTASDRLYQRFNTEGLTDLHKALSDAQIKNLWVYREKH